MLYYIYMAKEYQNDLKISLDRKTNEIIKQLPDFSNKFFKYLKTKGASERTRHEYAYDLKKFFEYISLSSGFKNKSINSLPASEILDKLTYEDIQEYFDTLNTHTIKDNKGKQKEVLSSPSTRARKISSLRSFYKFYFKIGDIKSNIADLIELPKIPNKNIVVMDKQQVSRLLETISDTSKMDDTQKLKHSRIIKRDYAIMMLFFGTGIRVSELVGIDLEDIDLYNASLLITRKGGDEDEVYFGFEVQSALEDYINNCRDELLAGSKNDALFISIQKKRMSVRSVQSMIKNYAKKAGLNMKITPHAMRRTFGTNLYENTSDIYLVADALHHSSIETTRKHYAKMNKDHKRIAAKVSSNLFKKD